LLPKKKKKKKEEEIYERMLKTLVKDDAIKAD